MSDARDGNGDPFGLIHEFFSAGLNNEVTEEQLDVLERLLAESDEACDLYVRYAQTTVLLPRALYGAAAEIAFRSTTPVFIEPCITHEPGATDGRPENKNKTFSSGSIRYAGVNKPESVVMPVESERRRSRGVRTASFDALPYLATALVAYLVAVGTWYWRPVDFGDAAKDPRAMPAVVGHITGMLDCRWAEGTAPAPNRYEVAAGQRLQLRSGAVEITYDSGAKVILQGPATYYADAVNGGFLEHGRLTGKVDAPAARGFFVRTPTITLVDLGTEFGLEALENQTRSHVFQGKVNLASAAAPDLAAAEYLVTENDSLVLDGRGTPLANERVDGSQFVRYVPPSPFPGLVDASKGRLVFEETFARVSGVPANDYRGLRFDPEEIGRGEVSLNRPASATVHNGLLRLTRGEGTADSLTTARPAEVVMTSQVFSGPVLISAALGSDGRNPGGAHVALRIGEIALAFHPGLVIDGTMRGAFRVEKGWGEGIEIPRNMDMGFVPGADALHHMYVYFDGRRTYYVCLVDGLDARRSFRTTFTSPLHDGKKFAVGISRVGRPGTGLFSGLRVTQLSPQP